MEDFEIIPVGKAKNIIGETFGEWTVLNRIKPTTGRATTWLCQCSCGNKKAVRNDRLIDGRSKSCGCKKYEDLTGKIFGKLTVLYKTKNTGINNDKVTWHCICECGNEKDIRADSLKNGNTKSCGCLNIEQVTKLGKSKEGKFKDKIGERHGKLVVIESTNKINGHGHRYWKCRCDCGNETIVSSENLRFGNSGVSSCGCLTMSLGELKISNLLTENNIPFIREKTFEDCKITNTRLRFDFYVNDSYIIEFDGEQHFKAKLSGWDTEEHLKYTQEHDRFKNNYCKNNNIPIIRIPYTHLKELCIEDLLLSTSDYIIRDF